MVVTKREILVSIIIVCFMLSFGLVIHNNIVGSQTEKTEMYNKSLKISDNDDMFKYSMETDVGNAIVYGKFESVGSASDDFLKGKYMYIEKITERYTRHYRQVCKKTGKTKTCHTETYYTWDEIDNYVKHVANVKFSSIEFSYDKFKNYKKYRLMLNADTVVDNQLENISCNYLYRNKRFIYSEGDLRYYYYVSDVKFSGTVFVNIKNNDISNENVSIYDGDIDSFIENNTSSNFMWILLFWFLWLLITSCIVYAYVYKNNDYLEDRR